MLDLTLEQLQEIKTIHEELMQEAKETKDYNLAFKFKESIKYIEKCIEEYQ